MSLSSHPPASVHTLSAVSTPKARPTGDERRMECTNVWENPLRRRVVAGSGCWRQRQTARRYKLRGCASLQTYDYSPRVGEQLPEAGKYLMHTCARSRALLLA